MTDLNDPTIQKILQSKTFAHLATIGSNGEPQSSPMWFLWDGEYIKFTHTTNRKKYQNIKQDPRVSISITDVDEPYTYAEFRGVVERIEDDPNGIFFNSLAEHYGAPMRYPGDPRVIFYVKIQHIAGQNLGSRYTQVLIAKPDINVYEALKDVEGLRGQQVQIIQEVRTGEALIYVFKTTTPLNTGTVEAILHAPGMEHISANLDGTQRQPHVSL
ncbi:MAG: PPOX class F420-dependent oxidoreductase [Ktedonobacteraceae bacterium]|nr:PPOX class F420-dependent oxidoreductase [Ktedonobacteraceae bacterium]